MKLFRQDVEVSARETFYVVAKDKKEADEILVDSSGTMLDIMEGDIIPYSIGDPEEVKTLTPAEKKVLEGVIWSSSELMNEARRKKLDKVYAKLRGVI